MATESDIPEELKYSEDHEWLSMDNGIGTIGITDYAQSQLGDIVFVELPAVGATTQAGQPFGTIESVKAVSDLFAPVSGEVVAINGELADRPELVNEACYGEGWLIRLRPSKPEELARLLDAAAYRASVKEREG